MLEHHYFNYESLVPSFFLLQTELQKKQIKIVSIKSGSEWYFSNNKVCFSPRATKFIANITVNQKY